MSRSLNTVLSDHIKQDGAYRSGDFMCMGSEASPHCDQNLTLAMAAAAAVMLLPFQKYQKDSGVSLSASNQAPRSVKGRRPPVVVQCDDATVEQGSDFSVVTIRVEKDRPGLLSEVSELLKGYQLDIKDAKITTDDDEAAVKAKHTYIVQDAVTGTGMCDSKLSELCGSLEALGDMSCHAKSWPRYTRAEVAKHTTKETGIWVTYKNGVYDITKFVANHPGGQDKIMLAAGKAIDPFWRIYQQHEGRETAPQQLATMRIGDLADPVKLELGGDPYDADPERHPGMIMHNNKPCNAELPSAMMMDSWCTPNSVFFIRHHHPVPVVEGDDFRLVVTGEGVVMPVSLTLEDLRKRFLKREVVSTIQCGGNRRSELDKVEKTSGIPWGIGAVSTAKWGGVYLREVLMHCGGLSLEGVDWNGLRHVVFHGLDGMQASIPIEKALSPFGDVLLAYEMNDEILPAEHGFPVRVIVPGVVGVRNVKWLGKIETSKEEAEGTWQRGMAYKGFSPAVKSLDGVDLSKILSIQEMPVQSSIVYPTDGSTVTLDEVEVKGWAWSGGGRSIVRVDVSLDGGESWTTADLEDGKDQLTSRAWAWTFWEASIPIPEVLRGKQITVLCKATDSSYNTQPERPEPIWNLRGLNCNCWHQINVTHDNS